MKATTWNGNATITKGCGSSRGEYYFSIGNLVAFCVKTHSSPDGMSYSDGCIPSTKDYFLQEEIELKEWDNSTYPGGAGVGPVGGMDQQKVVEIANIFWHKFSTQIVEKTFLLQIMECDKNVFSEGFIPGDITEVRNHPGRYLHIYEIPEGYSKCKAEAFAATVAAINLQKKQEDKLEAKKAANRYRDIELIFGITTTGWYASKASFGEHSVQLQHDHDSTDRVHYGLKIMNIVPNGNYTFYLRNGIPMSLLVTDGQPRIDTLTDTHWANSQSWRYTPISKVNIKKNWIFVDGEDVYEETKKLVDERVSKIRSARVNRFKSFSNAVKEQYGEEIFKLALRKKGQVLATLSILLANSQSDIGDADIKKALKLGGDVALVENIIAIVVAGVNPKKAAKIATKAYAWKYLENAFPKVSFSGNFTDAVVALAIYGESWIREERDESVKNTLGDFFPPELRN